MKEKIEKEKTKLAKTHAPVQSSLIKSDIFTALIILILLSCIIFIFFLDKSKIFISSWILAPLIVLLSLIDVWMVNNKIIYEDKSQLRSSVLKERHYLDSYLKKDSLIEYLTSNSISTKNDKFRIYADDYQLYKTNRWSAFNIENIGGYHPAILNSYRDITLKTGINYNNFWRPPPGILKTLNVRYYISQKRAPERMEALKAMYEDEFARALAQDESRASVMVKPNMRSYGY